MDDMMSKGQLRDAESLFPWGRPKDLPVEIATVIDAAAAEAARDPHGQSFMISSGEWPTQFEGNDRVFVYDQFSEHPFNLCEVYLRDEATGRAVRVGLEGGGISGFDPKTQEEPLCNQVRKAVANAFGPAEEGLVRLNGLGPKTIAELDTQYTGPFVARPLKS